MRKILLAFLILSITVISLNAQTGISLEYSVSKKGKNEITGTLKISSLEGNSLNTLTLGAPFNSHDVSLNLKANPDTAYNLLSNRTYIKLEDKQLKEYKIKILGSDSINGYKCVKIALLTRDEINDQTVWITNKFPSYEKYLTATVNGIDLGKLNMALKKKNLSGIPIRITSLEENSLQYDLVTANPADFDRTIFSIDNYTPARMMTIDELEKEGAVDKAQLEAMKQEMEAQAAEIEKDKKISNRKKKRK